MNNVTPIRPPMQSAEQSDPQTAGWVWDGHQCQWIWCGPHPEHPIWPPQSQCPPFPCPPFPPVCKPMMPPSCFSQIAKMDACWDQSEQLEKFLTKVITDIFEDNPAIIPSPPPSAGSGPIIGVTDGSNAAPGQVGEFLISATQWPYPAGPGNFDQNVSTLVVPPGDWDIWAFQETSNIVGAAGFYLTPTPVGMSNILHTYVSVPGGTTEPTFERTVIWGGPARGNFSVPTLLAFRLVVFNSIAPAAPAGTTYLQVEARRRR